MSTEARKRLAQKLKVAREAAGLSQEQIALALRLPRPAISQMENGNRRVEALELGRMAKLYGKPLAFFADEPQEVAWGHPAVKPTWLYFVGVAREVVVPRSGGVPTHIVSTVRRENPLLRCSALKRRLTPLAFAEWLVSIARMAAAMGERPHEPRHLGSAKA